MMIALDSFAHWLPPFRVDGPKTGRAASRTVPERFPMLFRLYDRRDGKPVLVGGHPLEWIGADPARAREELLHNRDPNHFEVQVCSPARPIDRD